MSVVESFLRAGVAFFAIVVVVLAILYSVQPRASEQERAARRANSWCWPEAFRH